MNSTHNAKVITYDPEKSSFLTRRLYENVDVADNRGDFQRDRDRIIHSRAFRRLMHKTQVFNANKGDHYRNRLTHTLEVMQIGRSIGRLLGLNEDLIEAIALGHDLGHTPFGHIGERALNAILYEGMVDDGISSINEDFKHNFQSLRVVDQIEQRTDDYKGINLTLAVREGILKHTKLTSKIGEKHSVFYHPDDLNTDCLRLDLDFSYTLEGQVVAISDEIAQLTHDIEDGIRGGIIDDKKFRETKLVQKYVNDKNIEKPQTYNERNQILKGLIGFLIEDVQKEFDRRITKYREKYGEPTFKNDHDVYVERCIDFSKDIKPLAENLAAMRDSWILCSIEIKQADHKAEYMIRHMYKAYHKHPLELPDYILARYYNKKMEEFDRTIVDEDKLKNDRKFKRYICDHIAGMSDQFAAREYLKLYYPDYY